jgi:AcrR family transcriptional regulator
VSHDKRKPPVEQGRAIKQERGRVTYDSLIDTGFRMLEERDIEAISIAELARIAGYSVGAFYARFHSKDEFFDALISKHLEIRTDTQKLLFATLARKSLVSGLVANVVNYYWEHHIFWRAVLRRTLLDPGYWDPFRAHFLESTNRFIERVEAEIGRPLDKQEKRNISFAFQTVMGTINIAILNQPGPTFIGQTLFIEELTRVFALVSGVAALLEEQAPAKSARSAAPKARKKSG